MASLYHSLTPQKLFRRLLTNTSLQKKFIVKNKPIHRSAGASVGSTNLVGSSSTSLCSTLEMKWIPTKLGLDRKKNPAIVNKSLELTVLSYNVLSQDLLEEHQYLYAKMDPKILGWNFRSSKILGIIQASGANIVCLQEVQADHFVQFFTPKLANMGYRGIYKKRTGDKPDGCAIFYDTSLFELVDNWPVEYFHPGVEVLSRDNIGLIAVLSPTSEHQQAVTKQKPCIIISTTHLLYNPRRHDIKLAQLQVLFSELDRIAYQKQRNGKEEYCPIILTGDFNFTPESSAFHFVTRGHFKYEGLGTKLLTPIHQGRVLGNELIPASLGISDQCQHLHVAESRTNTSAIHRSVPSPTFASGELSHRLKLRSAYSYSPMEDPSFRKATTYQNGWAAVDHMFFT